MTGNSFDSRGTLTVGDKSYEVYRLAAVPGAEQLPFSLKILLENLLRTEDGANVTADHVRALAGWDPKAEPDTEIQFSPARVMMQDLTGVPAVVDLAAMREGMAALSDHAVVADYFGRPASFERNVDLEFGRNSERFQFLRWGQSGFDGFKVVPPG